MTWLWISLGVAAGLAGIALLTAYICFRMAFYADRRPKPQTDEIDIPEGEVYEPYRPDMERWAMEVRQMPCQNFCITSFDGLKLCGKYYEYAPDAPIELMFHGYRGNSERDMPGGVQRCFAVGHSSFLVDQRCGGNSEGKVITFGINEHKDCLAWVDMLVQHFGPDVKIILTGISMGAATVLMAAGKPLPPQVIGVLADCGYSTPKAIIKKVIRGMKLPADLLYPFAKLAARVFGHFDLEETSPLDAMKTCTVPVILYHGEEDGFVPCDMSREIFEACTSRKALVTIPGADHGLAYIADPARYRETLIDFFHN